MFDIGSSELMVIAVGALLVIGSERLPRVARTAGHLVGRLQRYGNDGRAHINGEAERDELRKMHDDFKQAASEVQDVERALATELKKRRKRRNSYLGWVQVIVSEAFRSEASIPTMAYATWNGWLGLVLLGFAVVLLTGPRQEDSAAALGLGAVGLFLASAFAIRRTRPEVMARAIAAQGFVLVALALALAMSTVWWALLAPPLSSFRYGPAVVLVLMTYGALQVAALSTDPRRARAIRQGGLWLGLALEIAGLAALFKRAFH